MKLAAALAALLVVLQAPARSPAVVGPTTPRGAEPLPVLNAERAWTGADGLWLLLKGDDISRDVRDAAVRAIGRLEDPQQVRPLMSLTGLSHAMQAGAIAQSLFGFDPAKDPDLLRVVEEWMRATASQGRTPEEQMISTGDLAGPMSHIVYAKAEQVADVESMLRALVDFSANTPRYGGLYAQGVRGLEALARVNRKLAHFDDKTIALLAKCVRKGPVNADSPDTRQYAFMALTTAGGVDADLERVALSDHQTGAWVLRRAAMALLLGGGAGLDDEARVAAIRAGLSDEDAHVRYEAVAAWARHAAQANGCQPLVDALGDDDTSLVIEASDLLGDLCRDNDDITNRLEGEAVLPPASGSWQKQTHAFVALAKRSQERAAILMPGFAGHKQWWVRMYAAYAAGSMKDVQRLDTLAYDDNDNVREAALHHLRVLDPGLAQRAILAALDRTDVQLVRTAAGMIKEWPPDPRYCSPLIDSLQRLTKERSMSSRDARLALLDAIEKHARRGEQPELAAWLKDFDPEIAAHAADVIYHVSGRLVQAEPIAAPHIPTQPFQNLQQCVSIEMSTGHPITLKMLPAVAPIAVETFLKLATVDRYYDGLSFHRVVPNFVVQGGSPNANEYSGGKDYMRDEIGGSNTRGTVGLSTRGRNTGDAQFFINLVDNPRLDGNYTVFAHVMNMAAVDRIQEGDVMRSIRPSSCQ